MHCLLKKKKKKGFGSLYGLAFSDRFLLLKNISLCSGIKNLLLKTGSCFVPDPN